MYLTTIIRIFMIKTGKNMKICLRKIFIFCHATRCLYDVWPRVASEMKLIAGSHSDGRVVANNRNEEISF